jgi:ethanolamine ammonia-lyase large subunit
MAFMHTIGTQRFRFDDLRMLLARASPLRSGDQLAGVAAENARERVAAQMALAELPHAADRRHARHTSLHAGEPSHRGRLPQLAARRRSR